MSSSFQSRSIFKNAYRSDIIRVIICCGGLFIALWMVETTIMQMEDPSDWFYRFMKKPLLLPLSIQEFVKQPWSLLTFGFLDVGVWALFTNMIWLWIFGTVIEDLRGTNRVFPIFWFGSIFAGIVLLICSLFLPLGEGLYMSSLAGVGAVAAASIAYKPRYILYAIFNKGVPIYVFGILFLALTIFTKMGDVKSLIVFLAGILLGYLSQNVLAVFFDKVAVKWRKWRAYFSSNKNFIKEPKVEVKKSPYELKAKMDILLDKISESGMESLSKVEKEFLKKYNG